MRDFIEETAGTVFSGGCHCGAVRFEAHGPLRPIVVCHCTDCFGLSGYSWAATAVDDTRFALTKGADNIDWYASSDFARRGFCKSCHAQMFYRLNDKAQTSVSPGMLDHLDGLYTAGHIYRASLPKACHISSDAPDLMADLDAQQASD